MLKLADGNKICFFQKYLLFVGALVVMHHALTKASETPDLPPSGKDAQSNGQMALVFLSQTKMFDESLPGYSSSISYKCSSVPSQSL